MGIWASDNVWMMEIANGYTQEQHHPHINRPRPPACSQTIVAIRAIDPRLFDPFWRHVITLNENVKLLQAQTCPVSGRYVNHTHGGKDW